MNNYDEVEAMMPGTVFQFGDGAPWMRGEEGVWDLIPFLTPKGDCPIPHVWKTYTHKITILYQEPEENEEPLEIFDLPEIELDMSPRSG